MVVLVTSPKTVKVQGHEVAIADALDAIGKAGHAVGVISNHEKPPWFDQFYGGKDVTFVEWSGRQSGDVLDVVAKKANLARHDVLVLAGTGEDVQMGVNGRAVLMGAAWANDPKVSALGIKVANMAELAEIVRLSALWPGAWWFSATGATYSVNALTDLSTINKLNPQIAFAEMVTKAVKQGGSHLMALLTIVARSLLQQGIRDEKDLAFGVYPSSASANNDSEVLSDFCHRLRTTVSQVRFAARGKPLFIRHKPSAKRSKGGGGDRTDPADQIETVHINPEYRNKLHGRHVVVLDDCTTYGLSFGVAAALLRKAGAAKVTGVALGKFGRQLKYYEITIDGSPYMPIPHGSYKLTKKAEFSGTTNAAAQTALVSLLG